MPFPFPLVHAEMNLVQKASPYYPIPLGQGSYRCDRDMNFVLPKGK